MILNPPARVRIPEWGSIYYEALITAQGLPEPSSLRGSTLGTRAAEHKGCNGACKLIDGCSLALCSATDSVVSAGICHRNKVSSIAWLYRRAQPKDSILYITLHYSNGQTQKINFIWKSNGPRIHEKFIYLGKFLFVWACIAIFSSEMRLTGSYFYNCESTREKVRSTIQWNRVSIVHLATEICLIEISKIRRVLYPHHCMLFQVHCSLIITRNLGSIPKSALYPDPRNNEIHQCWRPINLAWCSHPGTMVCLQNEDFIWFSCYCTDACFISVLWMPFMKNSLSTLLT